MVSEALPQYKKTDIGKATKTSPSISWKAFKSRYLSREDGYKYEWLNGEIEKSKRTMDKTQLYILRNLLEKFRELQFSNKANGELITEADLFFLDKHRRPDIAFLTNEQIELAADDKLDTPPQFVIEVISNIDAINRVNKKLGDYRAANVKVVWHIFPQSQEVHVYCGENLDTVHIKRDTAICSAEPVLPDFQMPVSDIFKRKNLENV
jgi:Uma2 family endonuclease